MADVPLDIEADVRGLDPARPDDTTVVRGQAQVAVTPGTVTSTRLVPEHSAANPDAVDAVRDADWLFLGPGSWYTSVLPHLMVDDLRAAITETRGNVVVVLNLPSQDGETSGYTSVDLLAALVERAPDLRVHCVLADRKILDQVPGGHDLLAGVVAGMGGRLVIDDLASGDGSPRHDPAKLAAACARIIDGV